MLTLAITLAAAVSASPLEEPDPWEPPRPELVRQLESAIVMPPGANRLERYDRYYSLELRAGRPLVVGLFLERRPEQSNGATYRLSGPQRFEIPGGGCSILQVAYDYQVASSPDVSCNSEADQERRTAVRRGPRPQSGIVEMPSR